MTQTILETNSSQNTYESHKTTHTIQIIYIYIYIYITCSQFSSINTSTKSEINLHPRR
ncbi:hypothetical protein Leryth_027258 [Lithospermum erythrorhizon]|nr:hypothetical protein Leryth_027258 [Lithospermum erythrorhizon]